MARIGILGDLHLRATKPIHRIDNYYERQFEKLLYAFNIFKEQKCDFIIQPGDFFHNYGKDPYSITYDAIAFLLLHNITAYIVFGQHDIKFHNTELKDIPIQILNQTSLVTKLDNIPETEKDDVLLYGINWNDNWPKIEKEHKNKFKILVMHQMVINRKKLWTGQTDYYTAKELEQSDFDLIVCGDNHNSFVFKNKVINCGSLMRMNIDQRRHIPIFVIYDTCKKKLTRYEYPIEAHDLVLEHDKSKEDKQLEEEKRKIFASSLDNKSFEGQLDFRKNINQVIKQKRYRKRTIQIIEESLT